MKIKPHQVPQIANGMARVKAAAALAVAMLKTDDYDVLRGSIFSSIGFTSYSDDYIKSEESRFILALSDSLKVFCEKMRGNYEK